MVTQQVVFLRNDRTNDESHNCVKHNGKSADIVHKNKGKTGLDRFRNDGLHDSPSCAVEAFEGTSFYARSGDKS